MAETILAISEFYWPDIPVAVQKRRDRPIGRYFNRRHPERDALHFGVPMKAWERISPEPMSGCWVWSGSINHAGYGNLVFNGRPDYIHRIMFSVFVGPLLPRHHVHHKCRNHYCCNPEHLEQLPCREHSLHHLPERLARHPSPTHCPRGHEYTEANTYWSKNSKACIRCNTEKTRERRARRKASQ